MSLLADIGYALNPDLPKITEWEWERDGLEIQVRLLVGDDWKEHTIKQRPFHRWLTENDYLAGSYDEYGPRNDWNGEPIRYCSSYMDFLTEYLTHDIVQEYLTEKYQYRFA